MVKLSQESPHKTNLAAVKHILTECGGLAADERLLVLCDKTTKDIAEVFVAAASEITPGAKLVEIPLASRHGEEPPASAAEAMLDADLIMSLCQFSLAHTQARINAGKRSARFLSMPCYTWPLLEDPALTVSYEEQYRVVRHISDLFTNGSRVRVQTASGTDMHLEIDGRIGNCCPGFVRNPGDLGSPPDIESNVSPIEDRSHGVAVIDGSITCPEIGLVETPVRVEVRDGRIVKFISDNAQYVEILDTIFGDLSSKRRVLAECGVGLNPRARLTGSMLTDEGAFGCMHFGFGSNYTVGGQNNVDFHLDFVFKDATLYIDDTLVLQDGVLEI
jgi:leucyl aminopeptidase (aminopeptidase T)